MNVILVPGVELVKLQASGSEVEAIMAPRSLANGHIVDAATHCLIDLDVWFEMHKLQRLDSILSLLFFL